MERLTEKTNEGYLLKLPTDKNISDLEIKFNAYDKLGQYEDAEEDGLLIRLPVAIGETCWGWEYPTRIDEEDGSTWTICDIRRAKVVPKKFNIFMLDRFGESYFATQAEAEQALAKMKGE